MSKVLPKLQKVPNRRVFCFDRIKIFERFANLLVLIEFKIA
ncbi:hypothetical protein BBUWI9123_J0003 (plasmid) [Borreliella burgdorferi WI91-23]|nr:hypothetical protein BBUWI9123_J0003 [Borreliella burgdorferi WI91-23]